MDYYDIGDKINRADLNSLVYLLRKFKKLTTDLKIGSSIINTVYGELHFTDGFKSTGSNWIIQDNVTVTSDNALKNAFYTFNFTVFDKNLSGTVNYRTITITSETTGDEGVLEVEIPTSAFQDGDIILSDYNMEIIFDEHEYYTPLTNYNVTLTVEKDRILMYEDNTIYLTLKQGATVVPYALTSILIGGEELFATTDDNGVAEFIYTGKGAGRVDVNTPLDSTASVSFYDNPDYITAVFTGSNVTLGYSSAAWLISDKPVIIEWGDGTTNKVNNPTTPISHTYTDGETNHEVKFIGEITGLGTNCFRNCTNLQAIAIIEGITNIGEGCFYGCSALTSIIIPEGVTVIDNNAFRGCENLTSITLPSSILSIGQFCFYNCSSLTSINLPNEITALNYSCFYNCSSLTSIDIPYGVISIGNNCFRYCSGLTSLNIPNTVTDIGINSFANCTGLTELVIPDSVVTINDACFNGCNNLESVTLSNNLVALGNSIFFNCYKLESVDIPPAINHIGQSCFYNCRELSSVSFSDNLSSFAESAFMYCYDLDSISIPASVELIGNDCFAGCTDLIDYQLHWRDTDIIEWSDAHLVNNTNTKYSVPNGTYDSYVAKGYPDSKLIERGYRLILSTNKDIIGSSDTATVTATLLNDGVASDSKTLNYTVKHGNTVITSGTKTTDNNGQATITYTGTAIGEVQIIVEYSNLAQKMVTIHDSEFVDYAVTGSANSNYGIIRATKSVGNDGTTLTATGNNAHLLLNSSSARFNLDFCIEFDLLETNSGARIDIYDGTTEHFFDIVTTGHCILNVTSNGISGTVDGVPITTSGGTPAAASRVSFFLSTNGTSLKFKNLCLYPLNYGKTINIGLNKTNIYSDESAVISGVLLNDGFPVSSANVTIYQGSTSIGTVTTNASGVYSKTVTGLSAGVYTFKAVHDNIETNNVNLTVRNHTYNLSVAANKSSMYTDESVTISGVLTKDNAAYGNQTVTIYDGSTSKGTVTTNTNGAYSKTLTGLTAGSHTLKAQHTNATSSNVSLTVNNHSYSLTASASKSTLYTDESTVISGVLKKDNVVWAGEKVKIYDGSTLLDTVTTNSNGAYTKTVTGLSAGNHTLKAQHTNATSSNVSITVNTHTYSLTASASKTTIYNDESVTISGTLKKDNALFANQAVTIYQGSTSLGTVTTNANGVYSKTVSGLSVGTYTFKASYSGTNSNTVTVTVNNHTYNITASTDKSTLYTDESVTIGGVLTKDSNVYANQAVTVYDGSTSKGTATTNSSGVYSKVLTGLSAGSHSLKVGYSGVYSSVVSVTVSNHSYALTCSLDKVSMDSNETVTITGNLKKDNVNWANQTVNIYDGSNIIATVSTNSSGNFSKAVTGLASGSHSIRTVHSNVQSSSVGLTVNAYSIGISASSASIYTDGSTTISGVLTKNGSGWSGQSVTVYDGSTSKGTVTTDSNGRYSMTLSSLSAGSHSFKAVNTKVESGTVNVTVSNHSYSLSASASATSISYGQSVTLSGVLKRDNAVWSGQTITIYDGSTSLGTVTTDGNGNYSKTITGLSAGSHTLKASHSNVQSSNVGVTVNNIYSLTAGLSASAIYTDGSTVISGVLKRNNAVWSGQTITIYDGTTSKGTVTTDSNGAYSKTLSSLSAGTHTLKASHTNTSSGNVSLTVNNHTYSLTASAKSTMYTDESVTVSGVLKKDNAVWASQTITVYDGSTSKGTATTNNSGAYSKAVSGLSAGSHTLKAQHSNVTSSNMSVTVKNHSYNLTCTASSGSINYGDSVTINGALKKDNANWSGQTITIKEGNTTLGTVTTGSNGNYTKTITGLGAGSHSIKAYHTNAISGTATITVKNTYNLTISSNKTTIDQGESVTITGNLKKNGVNLTNERIYIYDGSSYLESVRTDNSGNYTKELTGLTVGTHTIKVEENYGHSASVNITVQRGYELNVTCNKTTVSTYQKVTFNVLVSPSTGNTESINYIVKKDGETIGSGSFNEGSFEYTPRMSDSCDLIFKFSNTTTQTEASYTLHVTKPA